MVFLLFTALSLSGINDDVINDDVISSSSLHITGIHTYQERHVRQKVGLTHGALICSTTKRALTVHVQDSSSVDSLFIFGSSRGGCVRVSFIGGLHCIVLTMVL